MLKKIKAFTITLFLFLVFPSSAFAATLSLSPSNTTLNKGCSYSVDVNLNTQSADTDGTDALLTYDTSRITVVSITQGSVYPDYPAASFDRTAGTISISGLSSVSTPFNGNGKFATINLTVNSSGTTGSTTTIKFDFDPNNKGKTTDSNVVQSVTVQDILDSVVDGTYKIGNGKCTSGSGTGTSGTGGSGDDGTGQGGLGDDGTGTKGGKGGTSTGSGDLDTVVGGGSNVPPGITDSTFFLSVFGSFLVILGIAGLALL